MNAGKTLQYIDAQRGAIQALVDQLDEIQVAFNAEFDRFKAQHDDTLDRLTDQVTEQMNTVDAALQGAIHEQLLVERKVIEERRQKVREEYLPKRQEAADELLTKAQAQQAGLRVLNPQLDAREEELKAEKTALEARLEELNQEIRRLSRGLGLMLHFVGITRLDRERQRIVGKLEMLNGSLRKVRNEWQEQRERVEKSQEELQNRWQLESVAAARLQAELDQLDDPARREDLALHRAVHYTLDHLASPAGSSDPALGQGLQEMVELNRQTDSYHAGLASVGGFIGLLRGIDSGLGAIRTSIEGLIREQEMHSAYLHALEFQLPAPVEAFHKQWPTLAQQFSDEKTIGAHPADFSTNVEPILDGPLSQAQIEAMFNSLGTMISRATARWGK